MMLCICNRPLVFTPQTVNGAYGLEGYNYTIMVTCGHAGCSSTRCAIMWESERAALERAADEIVQEPIAAE